jgi:transposase-like protein
LAKRGNAAAVPGVTEREIPLADPRLVELRASLGPEAGSRAYVEELRWPEGVRCPRCASRHIGFLTERRKYYCRGCSYQFRVSAGTVLHDSHLPLSGWLLAVGLILASERGYPATRLQRSLGIGYKSAWFVGHRIRAAMAWALISKDPHVLSAFASADSLAAVPSDGSAPSVDPAPPAVGAGLALLKRVAAGAYHAPSVEHLNAYWAEVRWRAFHRGDGDAFRRTVEALLAREPFSYETLVTSSAASRRR